MASKRITLEQVIARFWKRVEKTDYCWNWKGILTRSGYPHFSFHGEYANGHRFAYSMLRGPIPNGLVLDHLCRNRACVNPDHLEPVSLKTNILRGTGLAAINAKKTHCVRGHEFTPENTYRSSSGRDCRTCRQIIGIAYRKRGSKREVSA